MPKSSAPSSTTRKRRTSSTGYWPVPVQYRVLYVRVCRWVQMVVRFVCVIRAPVCPVCPVCPPHEHVARTQATKRAALPILPAFYRRNPARAVWIEDTVLLIYGAPRTPIALRRRGKPEPGNVAPHTDHGCAHRAGTIHKSHHDIHTCRM